MTRRYPDDAPAGSQFTFKLLNQANPPDYSVGRLHPRRESVLTVLDWLTENCRLLGLNGQNWMLIAGGGLLIYAGALALARFRRTRHPSAF
jgi:hypothetical protein